LITDRINGHYALCYTNHRLRLSELTTKMKEDTHTVRGPRDTASRQCKVHANIYGGSVARGPQTTVG